jgi:hypothetical protein
MVLRLVDRGWDSELMNALEEEHSHLRIVAPFIKVGAARRLLNRGRPESLEVVTRFNLNDFREGVSDTAALRLLLQHGARIRGIKHLHAKLYLFGRRRVVVTSANLTEAALLRNHEFGFVSQDVEIIAHCETYFAKLWRGGEKDLRLDRLEAWEAEVTLSLAEGTPPHKRISLADEGADAGFEPDELIVASRVAEAEQAFVKFFGESTNRAESSMRVLDEVRLSGCHWACPYPRGRRPKQVQDGALMFMGRLMKRPADTRIFGRAVGLEHRPGRDDASYADLAIRPWKSKWPHYVRVHHAEFVAGELGNGVSLRELMDTLGANAFASTQRNLASGVGNVNPRSALRQQPAVELSPEGQAWLTQRLQHAFEEHGKVPADELAKLDWPEIASRGV